MGNKLYIADKSTLDKVLEKTDFIIANLMAINNDETLKTKVAENYFNTRKTGKVFGVFFNDFSVSNSPIGIRKYDAENMIAQPSTDSVVGRNDFDNYSIFNGLTVNGYVNTDGDFVVTYFEGENGFSKTANDVYVLFGTSWLKIDIDSKGETTCITDVQRDGYFPMPGAVRPDKTIRPFIAMAKYYGSDGSDGKVASISGKTAYYKSSSESGNITKFHSKGTQYCSTTIQDRFLIETLFQIVFATRNSQSVMRGCTDYSYQYTVAKAESNVKRVILLESQANNFIIGSRVSVGDPGSQNWDRYYDYMHNLANRVVVTDIQNVSIDGTTYKAVYVDCDSAFTTTTTTVISSMPWHTGACDNVLGTCGSPVSNTNGKFPFIFFGIELMNGQYEVLGNAIYEQDSSGNGKVAICYDCTKLATSITSDYVRASYTIPGGNNAWKYVSELGFDKENPGVRMAVKLNATDSTGFCDGNYMNNSAGLYEVLVAGFLDNSGLAGLWHRILNVSLGDVYWNISARLSATGRCGVVAA